VQSATLWRRLLGVEKTVVEDVEFEEEAHGAVRMVESPRVWWRLSIHGG